MKHTIEVDTGLCSSHALDTFRLYASDLVILAKAMRRNEYLDICITDGIRRIAFPEMITGGDSPSGSCV